MRLTEQQIKEDDERWANRDIIEELQFCGVNVRPHNQTTKNDVRFNAWLCRGALKLIAGICSINSEAGGRMMDLIDRQRLLAEARKLNSTITGRDKPFPVAEAFMEAINRQPTVEPRAKGHWVPAKGGGCYCSECEEYALDEADGRYISVSVKSNYCPNCGAVMKGEV